MFDEIQKIIFPSQLSSFEYTKLNELLNTYTEEQIIETYKLYKNKPITYIEKVLKNKKKVPSWLNKDIENEKLEQEDLDLFNDFKNFIENFRNE
jgi:hypothetical protein